MDVGITCEMEVEEEVVRKKIIKYKGNEAQTHNIASGFAEMVAMNTLFHPNIICPISFSNEDDHFVIEMKRYVPLSKLAILNPDRFIQKIMNAFLYMHVNGYVHGDIKLFNVVVEEESGEPFVIDFGATRYKPKDYFDGDSPDYLYQLTPNTTNFMTDVWCLGMLILDVISEYELEDLLDEWIFKKSTETEVRKYLEKFKKDKHYKLIKMLLAPEDERMDLKKIYLAFYGNTQIKLVGGLYLPDCDIASELQKYRNKYPENILIKASSLASYCQTDKYLSCLYLSCLLLDRKKIDLSDFLHKFDKMVDDAYMILQQINFSQIL